MLYSWASGLGKVLLSVQKAPKQRHGGVGGGGEGGLPHKNDGVLVGKFLKHIVLGT